MSLKYFASLPLIISCSLSWADVQDYDYYVGLNGGLALMSGKHPTITGGDLEQGPILGAELGFRSAWWQPLEFRLRLNQGFLQLEDQEDYESATWAAVDALLFFPNEYNYLFVGSHYQKLGEYKQPGYHLGVGARHQLAERWALTGELQTLYGMDVETWDLTATVGVQYFFGERPKSKVRYADDDQDGVKNHNDLCPHTPAGYSVDEKGCTLFKETVISKEVTVLFEHNEARVPAAYFTNVKEIADFMKQHPQLDVIIEGHTSLVGSADYNKELSERRARAIKALLVERFDIPTERIGTQGYGESKPVVAPELSEADAAKNRRILVAMRVREEAF